MWIKKWISLAQFTILSTQSSIIVHLSMCCSLCTCMREYAGINAHQQIEAHGHHQFSHVLLAHLSWTMHSCTSYICKASLRCVFSYVLSHTLSQMIQSCTGFICQTSPNALLHYWLRLIKSGQQRFGTLSSILWENVTFTI